MATARVEDEPLKCPICYEHFNRPRKLPGCLHVFCENCLLTYIGNVKSEEYSQRIFQCPVCRKPASVPSASTESSEWVKSLDLKFDMESSSADLEEGLVKDNVCGPCKEKDELASSEKFCIDCQEYLCKVCSGIIHSVKLLKSHSMLDLQIVAESEPADVTRMLTEYFTCSRHSDKAVSYVCVKHGVLCCVNCIIENHKLCEGVKDLKDPADKTETEIESSKMKDQIQNAFLQIKAITDFRKKDVAENQENVEVICTQIREIRTKLNIVFDALEENVQIETKSFAKNYTVEADIESKTFEIKKQRLTAFLSLIGRIEAKGSHSQLFIVLRKLKSKVTEIQNEILALGSSCCRHELTLQIEKTLKALTEIGSNDSNQLATVKEDLTVAILPVFPKKNLLDMTAKKNLNISYWLKQVLVNHLPTEVF